MTRMVIFSSKIQKKFVITYKKLSLWIISFQVDLADNKSDAANIFHIQREHGNVRVFYKNPINCLILVILRNIRDINMKWFFGNSSVVLKSPITIITKS